jgi:hypothetical protein
MVAQFEFSITAKHNANAANCIQDGNVTTSYPWLELHPNGGILLQCKTNES